MAMSLHPIRSLSRSRHHNWNNSLNRSRCSTTTGPTTRTPTRATTTTSTGAATRSFVPRRHFTDPSSELCCPWMPRCPQSTERLNLETYAGFERGGVFNPGDSNGSVVIQRIDGGGMPPGAPLLMTKSNSSKIGSMRVQKIIKEHQHTPTLGRGSNLPAFFIKFFALETLTF